MGQQGRVRGRAVTDLREPAGHTQSPTASAALTVYHSPALQHLKVNQLLQRDGRHLSVLAQREGFHYIPDDHCLAGDTADNRSWLWGRLCHALQLSTASKAQGELLRTCREPAILSRTLEALGPVGDKPLRVLGRE